MEFPGEKSEIREVRADVGYLACALDNFHPLCDLQGTRYDRLTPFPPLTWKYPICTSFRTNGRLGVPYYP